MDIMELLNDIRDPKDAYREAMARDPMFWVKFLRRHNANTIEAVFMDRDYMTEEDFTSIVRQAAEFFALPMPVIKAKAETIAEVLTSEDAANCELAYNWQMMEKSGLNNKDALKLAFIHEMSHQFNLERHFMLFENELWIQELAADLLVGGFSVLKGDVATGKYKYVVSREKASLTHPDGKLRAEIVVYGREQAEKMVREGRYHGLEDLLGELPYFVYSHYKELQDAWDGIDLEEMLADEEDEAPKPIDYEALPDTNLLKQYYLKHKEEFKERNTKDDEQGK